MPGIKFKVPVGSDPRKVAIAHAVHQKTTVARRWTAARLEMKSALNVCQQIQRLKSGKLHLAQRDTAIAVKNRRLTLLGPFGTTNRHL